MMNTLLCFTMPVVRLSMMLMLVMAHFALEAA